MENLTTPFKATVIAYLSHALVQHLNVGDGDASTISSAAWMLLTAGLTYVVPKDFGSSLSAKMLAFVLRIRG